MENEDLARDLLQSLTKLSKQLKTIKFPEGMTRERLSTLDTIEAHGRISISLLADLEKVRPATMSRMVSSLEEDQYVRRTMDKSDGRGVLISVTAKGRSACRRAMERSLVRLSTALENLSTEQIRALHSLARAMESLNAD